MIRRTVLGGAMAALASIAVGATQNGATTICDALAAKAHQANGNASGAFAALTSGPSPAIQIAVPGAEGKNVSLERNPAADTRIQFEKRFRANFGESPALVRELRNWDALDVMSLPDSRVHMVLSTAGADLCESRLFFRTNSIRESDRLPDPPAGTDAAVCQNLGGWGYLARIGDIDAYLEYRVTRGRESFRIVPLSGDGWQTACTFTAPYKPSSSPSLDRFPTRP